MRRPVFLPLVAGILLVFAGCRSSGSGSEVSPSASQPPTQTPYRVVVTTAPRPSPAATATPLPPTEAPPPSPTIGSAWVASPVPTPPPPQPPTQATPPTQAPLPPAPTPVPPSNGAATVVSRGNPNRMTVAFTFDAGSDAGYAAMILDTLDANGIRASFGMTGVWAERNPDLVRRMVNEGHTLINHSYDHASFTGRSSGKLPLTQAQRWEELDRTEAIIAGLTGSTTLPYFRPPFGDYDASVNQDVAAKGYMLNVMWTVDSRGWMGWSVPVITQRCLEQAVPGAIYVFHVGSASQDGPALQGIIDGLRSQGYAIGRVADVLAP